MPSTFTNYGPGDEQTWGLVTSGGPYADDDTDDEALTEEMAEEFAEEELAHTPGQIAQTLANHADEWHVVDLQQIAETIENGFPCTLGELLVMLVEGDDANSKRAKYMVREKLRALYKGNGDVANLAADKMREAQPAVVED